MYRQPKRELRPFLLLMALSVLLTACAGQSRKGADPASSGPDKAAQSNPTQTVTTQPAKLEKATIRLSYKIKGEFAPLYVAAEKGFYKELGLDVSVEEGSGAIPLLQAIAAGQEQFGYLGAPEMALAIDQGMPVVMVANFVKKMPMVVIGKDGTPLKSPKDLEGKSLAVAPSDSFTKFLPAFSKVNGVDINKIKQVQLDQKIWNQALLTGQVDLIAGYSTNELPVLQLKTDGKLSVLNVWQYGIDFLAHGLVAHKDMVQKNPDLVRKVIAGTIKGFEYTRQHPDEAAQIIQKKFPDALDPKITPMQVKAILELLDSSAAAGKPLGYNPPGDWKRTLDLLESTNQIKMRQADTAYYTNDYIPSK